MTAALAVVLALQEPRTAEEWMARLEERLAGARTIRVETAEVSLRYVAPNRLGYSYRHGEIRAEGRRAAHVRETELQWLRRGEGPDATQVPWKLTWEGAYGYAQIFRRWPEVSDLHVEEARDDARIAYRLSYAPGEAEEVELWLDRASGLPLRRRTSGRAGLEEYTAFVLDGEIADEEVEIPEELGLPPVATEHPWLGAPPRVTLGARNVPLTLACAELMEQTGWTFGVPADLSVRRVTVEGRDLAPWDAIRRLEGELGDVRVGIGGPWMSPFETRGTVAREQGGEDRMAAADLAWYEEMPPATSRTAVAGPFRVEISSMEVIRTISSEAGGEASLRMELRLDWLPGTRVLDVIPRRIRIRTDAGEEIAERPTEGSAARRSWGHRSTWQGFARHGLSGYVVQADLPDRPFRRIERITGVISALVPAVVWTERIEALEGGVTLQSGALRAEVGPATVDEQNLSIPIRVEGLEPRVLDSGAAAWLYVWDQDGRFISESTVNMEYGRTPTCRGVWRMTFQRGRSLGRVVLEVHSGERRLDFPFEVRDVDLPW